MYLHLKAQTAADFEEALRRLAVASYGQKWFNRVEPIHEPEFFERFSGMFAAALKSAGAVFDESEPRKWNLTGVDDELVVPVSAGYAEDLEEVLRGVVVFNHISSELLSAPAAIQAATRWVMDELERLLALPSTERPREQLQSAA